MAHTALASRPTPDSPSPGGQPRARAAGGDEPRLVERARRGDAAAFAELVRRHQDRAYAVALRISRSPAEAAEATQEALVRAWQALPGFRGDAGFGTWLHTVVARRALDRAEAMEARRRREVDAEAALEVPTAGSPEPDPFLARQVERLLGGLSPAQRAVVTLYYLEEQSVGEIAAALRMPENTVKTHLHRARAALRSAWGGEGGET